MSAGSILALVVATAVIAAALFQTSRHRMTFGKINGRYLRLPPRIDDPKIGRSRGLPVAIAFRIAEDAAGFPAGVGRRAHRAHFAGQPPPSIVIKYASARPDLFGRSDFANPDSIWYDVFAGYCQVDVDQEDWGRPFGYDVDARGGSRLRHEELARLVRADWNHLSASVYGVPDARVEAIDALGQADLRARDHGRVRKEGRDGAFDEVTFDNVTVVGPYSARGGADYQDRGLVGRLWRSAFGVHRRVVADINSFEPCTIRLHAYACFRPARDARGRAVWQTFVFGGAVNHRYDRIDAAENARFLALQMSEFERIIGEERGLGFPADAPAAKFAAGEVAGGESCGFNQS